MLKKGGAVGYNMNIIDKNDSRNIIVFDLEWNQNSYRSVADMPHEIIEIGACKVNYEGTIVSKFNRMIKPALYKKIDSHIREVTGIEQSEINHGDRFESVYREFVEWCGNNPILITWGRDDFSVLKRNVEYHHLDLCFEAAIDIQLIYGYCFFGSTSRQMNLQAALEYAGIEKEFIAHRAVNDAEATCALLPILGEKISCLNNSDVMTLIEAVENEKRISSSMIRTVPTKCYLPERAIIDIRNIKIPCPTCGEQMNYEINWFSYGRNKFESLMKCRNHSYVYGKMNFKKTVNGRMCANQKIYPAIPNEVEKVRNEYRQYSSSRKR